MNQRVRKGIVCTVSKRQCRVMFLKMLQGLPINHAIEEIWL